MDQRSRSAGNAPSPHPSPGPLGGSSILHPEENAEREIVRERGDRASDPG